MSAAGLALALGLVAAPPAPSTPAPAAPEQAAPREVHSRTSAPSARLGEPFEWAWRSGTRRPSATSSGRRCPRGRTGPSRSAASGVEASGEATTTCRLRLALLALGPVDLPPLRLTAITPGGPRVLDVPGPRLTGNGVIDPGVPADQLQLRPLAPPVPLLVPSWRLAWWALGALGLALLGWRLWRWWKARRRAGEAPAAAHPSGASLRRPARRARGGAARRAGARAGALVPALGGGARLPRRRHRPERARPHHRWSCWRRWPGSLIRACRSSRCATSPRSPISSSSPGSPPTAAPAPRASPSGGSCWRAPGRRRRRRRPRPLPPRPAPEPPRDRRRAPVGPALGPAPPARHPAGGAGAPARPAGAPLASSTPASPPSPPARAAGWHGPGGCRRRCW